jgi:hypothetical protein
MSIFDETIQMLRARRAAVARELRLYSHNGTLRRHTSQLRRTFYKLTALEVRLTNLRDGVTA